MHDPAPARVQPAPSASPLFVEQSGAGTPLLLIHGLMVSGAMYQGVLPALAAHYRVIVPDLRGHCRSGALPGPYSVEQLGRDLAQLLDDLQVDAAHVLGYSQGGAVAQLRIIDGAGHTLIWTHTDIFIQAVDTFLASVNHT